MLTVGKVSKMFGLSRTALLYYDSIGILSPSERGANEYRLYSERDIEKLRQIISLKNVGIPLNEIQKYLHGADMEVSSILLKRLDEMNNEIENIRKQQDVIIRLLKNNDLKAERLSMNSEKWFSILNNAGINADTALKWHASFEKHSPNQHESLLLAIGLTQQEISHLRISLNHTSSQFSDEL